MALRNFCHTQNRVIIRVIIRYDSQLRFLFLEKTFSNYSKMLSFCRVKRTEDDVRSRYLRYILTCLYRFKLYYFHSHECFHIDVSVF